jgi:hypothetical protein
MESAHYKLGNYGAGTLWYLRNRSGTFVQFNRLNIAKLEPGRKRLEGSRAWVDGHRDWEPRITGSTRL